MFLLRPDIFPWDLAILLLMAFGLSLGIFCWFWITSHRKSKLLIRILVGFLGFVGFFGFLLTFYGSFIEPHTLVVTKQTIHLPVTQPLRIAVISDIHVGPYTGKAFVQKVVDATNTLHPDLILLPGDFIAHPTSDMNDLQPLASLRAPLGVYAVLGNHDQGRYQTLMGKRYVEGDETEAVKTAVSKLGITVLENQRKTLDVSGQTLVIAGVNDIWSRQSDIARALKDVPATATVILVAHNPDIILDPRSHRAQLIVTGHTHGGQIRLPFIGPIAPIPNRIGRQYDQGLFPVDNDTTLAITRGVGTTLARARLFAWPEILVLENF